MKFRIAFLLCWLSSLASTRAEDLSQYEIVFHYRDGTEIEDRLDFVQKGTRQVVNSFNIVDNNPYNRLDFPIREINPWGLKDYDVSQVNRDQLFAMFLPHVPESEKANYDFEMVATSFYCYKAPHYQPDKRLNYTAVSYVIGLLNPAFKYKAVKSTVFVLNAKGEIVFTLRDEPTNCDRPLVTDDGKYLALHCGGSLDESLIPVTPERLRIYDTTKKVLMVERGLEGGFYNILGPSLFRDRIQYNLQRSESTTFLVFDMNKRIAYSKEYTLSTLATYVLDVIPEVDGFVLRKPAWDSVQGRHIGEIIQRDTFDSTFKKEKF